MGFSNWIGLLFNILIFFIIGTVIIAVFGSQGEVSDTQRSWAVAVGLAVMFGGPWLRHILAKSRSECGECGKKWSLVEDGSRDGEVTELHERIGGELKLVHKWDHYQDWKCKSCGDETTQVIEKTRTV